MKSQQNNICSKVVLTKTFKLDDFENNMNVKELFYKSILVINESHANGKPLFIDWFLLFALLTSL